MHGSTYIDTDHHGRAARLNGPHSWTPDPLKDVHGNAPYLVINLVASGSSRNAGYKIHGISTQGDPVFQTWVTKFTMETTIKSKDRVKSPESTFLTLKLEKTQIKAKRR